MATITAPPAEPSVEQRIRFPLERLRSYIRWYVGLEGLALVVIYLAVWFWIGLTLDYGSFRLLSVDWVQELPRFLRALILVVLAGGLLGLVAIRLLLRLAAGLRDSALALLLERRFHDRLGDRLITAVEMADPRRAEAYGYSTAMLDSTIREASARAAILPIADVLDWDRLRRLGARAGVFTFGMYLVLGVGYCAARHMTTGTFISRFNDVAIVWFERNILLHDVIWPRRAHLALLNESFASSDELKIGRDAPPPMLQVRAFKWVIADGNRHRAPEGWRALRWADVTRDLMGEPIDPDLPPPDWRGWTLDDIQMELDRPEVVNALPGSEVLALHYVLDRIHELGTSSHMSRRLRELDIPTEVTVYYRGAGSRSEQTMQKQPGNRYSGAADVKESVRFTVRGLDYYTPSKRIAVVPRPMIVELTVDEAQPAYLYHRPPVDGSAGDLLHQKQRFVDQPISLTGDTSRIDVPIGTDLVLKARTDKALAAKDAVRLLAPRPGVPLVEALRERSNDHSFRLTFDNVTVPLDMMVDVTDTDGVHGQRHVTIRPVEDAPPEVDVQVEVVRRTNQGYLVTPNAQVPFSGKVRDDHGLTRVEYACTAARVESAGENQAQAVLIAGLLPAPFDGLGPALTVAGWLLRSAASASPTDVRSFSLATFDQLARDQARSALPRDRLLESLNQPPAESLLKVFDLDPEFETFSVERLGLKTNEEKGFAPHYRVPLWVQATDNNVETGPRTGRGKEVFTLMVVSENELLAEIAREEETLHIKLEDAVNRLRDGKIKLEKVARELPDLKPEELSPMARRAEEVGDGVIKSWDASREVFADYQRILKELRANRVQPGMVTKVNDKICEPLDAAINVEFVQTDESLRELQKRLDEKNSNRQVLEQSRQRLDRLIQRLQGVLEAMADVTSINKIIEMLVKIEKGERREYERLHDLLEKKRRELFDNLLEPPKPK